MRVSCSLHPFHVAARWSMGYQSSNFTSRLSPSNASIGGERINWWGFHTMSRRGHTQTWRVYRTVLRNTFRLPPDTGARSSGVEHHISSSARRDFKAPISASFFAISSSCSRNCSQLSPQTLALVSLFCYFHFQLTHLFPECCILIRQRCILGREGCIPLRQSAYSSTSNSSRSVALL